MADSSANAISAALPSSVGDLLHDLLAAGHQQAAVFGEWWNGFASPVFAALTKAGLDPTVAAQLVFSEQMPKPAALGRLSLRLNGSVTTMLTNRSGQQISGSLGFTPLAGALAGLGVNIGGQMTSESTSSSEQQAVSVLEIDIVPAGLGVFNDVLVKAIAGIQLPPLPAFNPGIAAPAQSTSAVVKAAS